MANKFKSAFTRPIPLWSHLAKKPPQGPPKPPTTGSMVNPGDQSFGSTPTPTPPTATQPASPAAPSGPAPAPWNTDFEAARSNLDLNKTTALGRVAQARTNLSQVYGWNADGSENTTDPFSRLAMLKADYQKIKRGTSASFAARGMGYDGAYQNAVDRGFDKNLRATDALKKSFDAENTAIDDREAGINTGYNTDLNSLYFNRAQAAAIAAAQNPEITEQPKPEVNTRRDSVLAALNGSLTPAHRRRLEKEARRNGWI